MQFPRSALLLRTTLARFDTKANNAFMPSERNLTAKVNMMIKVASIIFQTIIVNVILGYLTAEVGLSIRSFKQLREARQIDKIFMLGVIIMAFTDVLIFHIIYGIDERPQKEIMEKILPLALFLSPLNLLWARSSCLGGRNFQRDFAMGLASSYFYGYLQKVGPLFETSIMDSQEHNGNRFPLTHWILIPKNGVIFDTISTADPRISFKSNSKSIRLNYSGVHQRPYHFSLYEIVERDFAMSCCLEYASALRVLDEMKDVFGFERKEIEEIVMMFYETIIEYVELEGNVGSYVQFLLFSGYKEDIVNEIKIKAIRDLFGTFGNA